MRFAGAIVCCLLSILLFVAALALAIVGVCGAWKGAAMFLSFSPQPMIAGFLLVMVSLIVPGCLALFVSLYGLNLQAKAYDFMQNSKDLQGHEKAHQRRFDTLATINWILVVVVFLLVASIPASREFLCGALETTTTWSKSSKS